MIGDFTINIDLSKKDDPEYVKELLKDLRWQNDRCEKFMKHWRMKVKFLFEKLRKEFNSWEEEETETFRQEYNRLKTAIADEREILKKKAEKIDNHWAFSLVRAKTLTNERMAEVDKRVKITERIYHRVVDKRAGNDPDYDDVPIHD